MGKETFISKDLKEKFKHLSKKANQKYDIHTQLVQIVGKRWSYVTGEIIHDPTCEVKRIILNKHIGIIAYLPKGGTVTKKEIKYFFHPLINTKAD